MIPDDTQAPDAAAALRAASAFDGVPDEALRELAADAAIVILADGQVVADPEQGSRELYLVVSGVLTVVGRTADGAEMPLQDFEPGALVGGLNLFPSGRATLSIRARGPAVALVVSRAAFDRFASGHPHHALAVLETLKPLLRRERLWLAMNLTEAFQDLDAQAVNPKPLTALRRVAQSLMPGRLWQAYERRR